MKTKKDDYVNGIHLESKNRNKYFYDNNSGFIFPDAIKEQQIKDFPEMKMEPVLNEEVVKNYLHDFGFKQLILELTQECNLRCKYCWYSEHYFNTRNHGHNSMSFCTAKKAVDFYMRNFIPTYKRNPMRNPTLSFYGGEPLLNIKVMNQIMEYFRTQYPQFQPEYNITTNGVLLSEENIDFLVANNFAVIVSLDGGKENHDRNRVNINNEGTFDTIFDNVLLFKKKYPDFQKLGFSMAVDYRTDLYKLNDFVTKNDLFVVFVNTVSSHETDYYEQFTKDDEIKFFAQLDDLRKKYFKLSAEKSMVMQERNLLMSLFAYEYIEFGCHSVIGENRLQCMPYTGSCIPGDKMYVTIDGQIHICERINHNFPIGNVDEGLNYSDIVKYIGCFNNYYKKCSTCDVSRVCNICFSSGAASEGFVIPEGYCNDRYEHTKRVLYDYINLMEDKPNQLNDIVMSFYSDLKNKFSLAVD